MSAYVVDDATINKVVTWIVGPHRDWERRIVENALAEQGSIGDTFEEKLGNSMFELNCNAVEQRYGDGQAKEFRPLDYQFKAEYSGSNYAIYDLIGTWIYQCSEGDVPENSKLYKAIEQIYNNMAHTFFRDLRDRDQSERSEMLRRIQAVETKLCKTRPTP